MLRTSRCFRIKLFQFVGPRALPAIALFPYSLFSSFKRNLALWGHAAPPRFGPFEIIPETIRKSGPIYFRQEPARGRRAHNVKGERAALSGAAGYFRGPRLQGVSHGRPANRLRQTKPATSQPFPRLHPTF